jgi:hypothetical protein
MTHRKDKRMSKRTAMIEENHLGVKGIRAFKLHDGSGKHVQYNRTSPLQNAWAEAEMALWGKDNDRSLSIRLTEYGETGTGRGGSRSRTVKVDLTASETHILYTMLKDALGE